jgi:hypothetical protein
MRVHKKTRAKVALALEFEAIVIAVLSLDLLVQVGLPYSFLPYILTLSFPLSSVGGIQEALSSRMML